MKDEFTKDQATFWGAIASLFWFGSSVFKYLAAKANKKDTCSMMSVENEGVKMEQVGIKETKEVLEGMNAIAIEVIAIAKDGIQAKDAVQLYEDVIVNEVFKAKMIAAFEGLKMVPVEIKDIDFMEAIELGKFEYDGVKNIIEALKK